VLSINFYTIAFLISTMSVVAWFPVQYWQPEWSPVTPLCSPPIRRETSRKWLTCILFGTVMSLFDHWMLNSLFGLVIGATLELLSR